MPSNKVKYFVEKLLADEKNGDIKVSVNKKDRKVFVTVPENLIKPMLVQFISKLKSLPGYDLPTDKVIKTPFFSYTSDGIAVQSRITELGGPSLGEIGGFHTFQTVFDNLKNGCAMVITAVQMDQLCKSMGLNYGFEDFVFVMDVIGDSAESNITNVNFKLEDRDELTPEQFKKAFQAKVKGERFSFLRADANTRLKNELPVIDMNIIKEKAETNPDSDTAKVYRKLSG